LQQYLLDAGIGTMVHYPVLPPYSNAYKGVLARLQTFPQAEAIVPHILSLPISPHHGSEEISYAIATIRQFALRRAMAA
jgi:dTDP-4-amino-4,6-dideoxygalactose transaminase